MGLKRQRIAISDIYIPLKKRQSFDPQKNAPEVEAIAESMLEKGQESPILVRVDGKRYVLVEGIKRLEASKMLGEQMIDAFFVQARLH